jgi:hypothetical protein
MVDEHEPAEETATSQVGQSGSRKRKQEEIVKSVEERKKKIVRMCTSDEPWTLPMLPVELQKRILCFVGAHYWGATQDVLHCEPKCRGLYQAIHDDDNGVFWKYCIGANLTYHHFPAMSHRERACVYDAIRQIRKEQKKTDNILESCMGIPQWIALIDYLVASHVDMRAEFHFHIRGDASLVLMELVQQGLINHFDLANRSLLNGI